MQGILKGYDQLLNLVLDDVEELASGNNNTNFITEMNYNYPDVCPESRSLGLAVLRGPTVTLLSPVDGAEEIANPFAAPS